MGGLPLVRAIVAVGLGLGAVGLSMSAVLSVFKVPAGESTSRKVLGPRYMRFALSLVTGLAAVVVYDTAFLGGAAIAACFGLAVMGLAYATEVGFANIVGRWRRHRRL